VKRKKKREKKLKTDKTPLSLSFSFEATFFFPYHSLDFTTFQGFFGRSCPVVDNCLCKFLSMSRFLCGVILLCVVSAQMPDYVQVIHRHGGKV
jgi:hypothetical protein